jgi:hypothetical protein
MRTASFSPKQLCDERPGGNPLGQGMPVTPMSTKDNIIVPQVGTDTGSDSLLTDVGMAGTWDESPLIRSGKLLLATSDNEHLAVQ